MVGEKIFIAFNIDKILTLFFFFIGFLKKYLTLYQKGNSLSIWALV